MEKTKIKEVIVCEGRDDTAAIARAVEADTIETHGFGMSQEMWERIEDAYERRGIIVFTDPDSAGERIRRKIKERFPDCKEAFLPRDAARKKDNIGVENASPEAICDALSKAHASRGVSAGSYTMQDLADADLQGGRNSKQRRQKLGEILGIGYGNAKTLLSRLNGYDISREEFYGALQSISDPRD